jgi:3-hydroxybutyrate dehydrogenase
MSLKNIVALAAGAVNGIGEQCARRLASLGAAVAIADLNLENAQRVVSRIVAEDDKASALVMDVTNEEAVNRSAERAVKEQGAIDALLSDAGIQTVAPVEEYVFSDWKKMLAIHVDGAFPTTKAAIKQMYAGGRGGTIVYMASVHSHEASKLKFAYVTARYRLLGVARLVAKEGDPRGVSPNVACAGFVRTPLVDRQIPEQAKALGISDDEVVKNMMPKKTVDGEFTTVEDVANTVAFLADFESSALTGQWVVVSHGWSMQ